MKDGFKTADKTRQLTIPLSHRAEARLRFCGMASGRDWRFRKYQVLALSWISPYSILVHSLMLFSISCNSQCRLVLSSHVNPFSQPEEGQLIVHSPA